MLNLKRGFSRSSDSKEAVDAVVSSINQSDVKFVIFFASSKYDFALVSKSMKEAFKSAEVIGCTTAGEIGPQGFVDGTLVAMSIAADDFTPSTAVIKDIKQRAMLSKNEVINAFTKTGMDVNDPNVSKKGFGIVLIDGLQAAEEKVMSVFSLVFKEFPILGGSAGDDLKFKETFVSANGEVYTNAAVVTFIKTNKKIYPYKENIYVPTEKELKVTKVDLEGRVVYEFNNAPAVDEYAAALDVTKDKVPACFNSHPLGRQFADNIWIASPYQIVDEGMRFYAQIMPNSVVKLLKAIDPVSEAKRTVENIKANLPGVKGIIGFNCILRYLQFKDENICGPVYNELSKLGEVIGFSTYGEQYFKYQVSQTLTLVALGE